MSESIKTLQIGAHQLEAGATGAGQSPGWGQSGSEETLGANNAFPWLSFGKGKTINTVQDNSVTSVAFQDIPRQVGQYVEKPLGMHLRFAGLDSFNYWSFGFENIPLSVVCFTLSTPSVEPTAGAVYHDGSSNSLTFRRKEVNNSATVWVFSGTAIAGSTGTLTKDSGTGDATLTFSANSGVMYEHLLELDAHERHFTTFRTEEQITGYTSGDKKNRMMTLGIKMGTNDFLYKNAMCKKFGIKSSSGGLAEMNFDFLSYNESRGDYSSANWTFPSTLADNSNVMAHHQMKVEVGASAATLVTLGVTDLSLDCDIPLQVIQDTSSGLYIAEPIMEGKYGIDMNMILSRYSAETYQGYRDNWTSVVARVSAAYGWFGWELLVQEAKIEGAGPDDDGVAKEPLHLIPGYTTTNNWSTWLSGNTLIQNSPILMRVRNSNSSNMMFSI